jgi:hypothetical protein
MEVPRLPANAVISFPVLKCVMARVKSYTTTAETETAKRMHFSPYHAQLSQRRDLCLIEL